MSFFKKIIGKVFLENREVTSSKFSDIDVEVSEKDGILSMHIGSTTIQSSMRINKPFHLELDYTRAMSMVLLFLENPKEILFIGLGGGTMPKFFYKFFTKAKLTVLEINLKVIQIAKHFFKLPISKRFNIVHGDGISYLKETERKYDLLLSDAFEDYGLPDKFCTISYFESCKNALSEKGIFVINLWGSDPKPLFYIDRINLVFDQQVLYTESNKPGNIIVFAFKKINIKYSINNLKKEIKLLEKNYGLNLMVYFTRLVKNNKQGSPNQICFH